MKRIHTLAATIAALAIGFTLLPSDASAQIRTRRDDDRWDQRDRDRDRDRGRDRRNYNIESLARRTERESNSFRDWFERNNSRRRMGRSQDNRWLKNEIQNLDEALERVRRKADDRRPERGRSDMQDAMEHARRIDRELVVGGVLGGVLGRDRDTRYTVQEWVDFRRTLDDLARAYGVRRF